MHCRKWALVIPLVFLFSGQVIVEEKSAFEENFGETRIAFAENSGKANSGNPEWHNANLYKIKTDKVTGKKWIEQDGAEAAVLKNYKFYGGVRRETRREWVPVYTRYGYRWYVRNRVVEVKEKKKLKLVSKLGFELRNIPADETDNYFYNECIAIFLEAEKYLPSFNSYLKENGYEYRSLRGLDFRFPDNPQIGLSGGTYYHTSSYFWICRPDGSRYQSDRAAGQATIGGNQAIVTYGYNRPKNDSVLIHEYLHICGYNHKKQSDDGSACNDYSEEDMFSQLSKRDFLDSL